MIRIGSGSPALDCGPNDEPAPDSRPAGDKPHMEQRFLGSGGLRVSALALGHSMGAQDFGAGAQQAFTALVHRALELGANFLDTSDAYWDGLHESWIGAALRGRRGDAVIASKFGNLTLPD